MEQSYKQKFYDKYTELLPEMMKLEKERKLTCFVFYATICVFILVLIFVFFKFGFAALLFLWVYMITSYIFWNVILIKFKTKLKRFFLNDFLKVFNCKNISQEAKNSFSSEFVVPSSKSSLIWCDDAFEGIYNNIKFTITEIKGALILSNNEIYTGQWSGVLMEFDFNKDIVSKLNIIPKNIKSNNKIFDIGCSVCFLLPFILVLFCILVAGFVYKHFGLILMALSCLFVLTCFFWEPIREKTKYEKVTLEDNTWENKFYVEAQDQIEARYVLTPSFMERLRNLKTVFGSKNVWCFVRENKIAIAISAKKDLFEIGNIFKPMNDSSQIRIFYDELTAIFKIIDYFKLNEKTGL